MRPWTASIFGQDKTPSGRGSISKELPVELNYKQLAEDFYKDCSDKEAKEKTSGR